MIKKNIRKLILKCVYGSKATSKSYITFLRKKGVDIGKGTIFYEPFTNYVDIQNPKLISIGENVRITRGVVILTHDYSWSVLAGVYGNCLGGVGPVKIDDNVFIGINACILKGVHIGSNVIIGAGSIVTHDCQSNAVYAGVPAKMIMTLEEFYKQKQSTLKNDLANIINCVNEDDLPTYLREYSCLYKPATDVEVIKLMNDTGYESMCKMHYNTHKRLYKDIDDLVCDIKKIIKDELIK